ncbi:MAG TPA: phasin [Brevundimonas sp.]
MSRKRTPEPVGEMMQAAGDVVAARLNILAAGLTDPSKADLKEMALMGSEKVEALSESAAAVVQTFGEIGGRLGSGLVAEAGLASRAAAEVAAAKTPTAAAQAQYGYAMGWWGRALSQALTFNTEMLKVQTEALRPIHKAAVANAKRLKK